MASGACNCGAVRFEILSALSDVFVCHCSICRRFSGNHGVAVVIVANEQFRWVGDTRHLRTWSKPGHDWQSHFCGVCGSALPGPNDADRMFVPAGLITEGGESLRVAHHIWVDSCAPWDEIGDGGVQHPGEFGSAPR